MVEFFNSFPSWVTALLTGFAACKSITILTPTRSDDVGLDWILRVLNILAGNVGKDKNADDKEIE